MDRTNKDKYFICTWHDYNIFAGTLNICTSPFTFPVFDFSAMSSVAVVHSFQIDTVSLFFTIQIWFFWRPRTTVYVSDIPTFSAFTSKSSVQLGTLMVFFAIFLLQVETVQRRTSFMNNISALFKFDVGPIISDTEMINYDWKPIWSYKMYLNFEKNV